MEEYRVSIVDINFGCPVRQVTEKAHSGSYLLPFPDRMGEIIERVVEACRPTPVTAKIRLGCTRDQINAIDVAQVVEGAGAAALTVHRRTAADFFKGFLETDIAPSPTAEATRFIESSRTSPAANTPGTLVAVAPPSLPERTTM